MILLVNTYMLIDCGIVGEYICYLIVILSVNAYMLSDGDFVGDCIYPK